MDIYPLFVKCLSADYRQTGGSADYAVEREGNTVYILFEDSDGAGDWSINIDFEAKAYRRGGDIICYAHRGFLDEWKRTERYVSAVISDMSVEKIIVAGYSHGAAMALLCHEYIWVKRPDLRADLKSVGFGCPRVIWGHVSRELARRWERFTVVRNLDDVVTHLPPSALGYSHVGKLIEIGEEGKYSAIEAHYAQNILSELKKYEKNK